MSDDAPRDLSRHPFLWPIFLDRDTAEYQARAANLAEARAALEAGQDVGPILCQGNRKADLGRMLDQAPKPDLIG